MSAENHATWSDLSRASWDRRRSPYSQPGTASIRGSATGVLSRGSRRHGVHSRMIWSNLRRSWVRHSMPQILTAGSRRNGRSSQWPWTPGDLRHVGLPRATGSAPRRRIHHRDRLRRRRTAADRRSQADGRSSRTCLKSWPTWDKRQRPFRAWREALFQSVTSVATGAVALSIAAGATYAGGRCRWPCWCCFHTHRAMAERAREGSRCWPGLRDGPRQRRVRQEV